MNTIQKLHDSDLITATKQLVDEERMKTIEIIEHLQEIYDRRLHLKRGYQSLHEFLVKELAYSDGAAHRRIAAMRLVNDVPEAKQSLADGKLSLTTASQVQNFFQTEKRRHKSYDVAEKLELLTAVAGTSRNQCERKLAEISPAYAMQEKTLTIPEDNELVQLIDEYRRLAMLSDGTHQKVIKEALKFAITQKREKTSASKKTEPKKVQAGASLEKPPTRYVRQRIKRVVWQRDAGRCAYIDPKTKRRCESKHRLELDHAQPFAMGGKTTAENLRLACKAHNQMFAVAVYGMKKISSYIEPLSPCQKSVVAHR